MFGLPSLSPVRTLNCHPCHGQVTISPESLPSPIGPPACGQVLSTAKNVPFTLNNAIQTPLISTVLPVPGGMFSTLATVTNSDMRPQDVNEIVTQTAFKASAEWPQRLISGKSYGIEHIRAYPRPI